MSSNFPHHFHHFRWSFSVFSLDLLPSRYRANPQWSKTTANLFLGLAAVPLSTAPVQPTFSVAPPIPFIPTSFGAQKSSCRPDAAQVASDYGDAKSHQYSHRYTSNVKPDPHTQLSAERSASRLPAVVSLLDGSPSTSVDGSSTHLSLRGGAASSGHKTTTTPTSENHKLVHLLDMRHGHNGSSTLEYPMRDSMIPPGWNTSGRVIAQRERLLKAAVEAATAVADSHFGMPQREHNPANNKTASSDIYHITDTTYGYRDGFRDGYKEGRKEGFRDERNYREAFKDGFREGRVGGYLDGKQEGYRGGGMVDGALATGLDEEWDIDQYGNLLESFKSKGWRGPSAHTTSRSVSNQIPQQIGRPPVEPAPLQIDTSASNRLDSQLPPHAQQHLSFSTSSSAVSPRSREAAPQTRNEISSNSNDRSPNGDSPDESTERHNRHHRRRSSNGQRHHSGSERDCEKRGSNDQRAANRRRDQRNSGSNSSESPDSSEGSRGYKRRSPERSSGASKNASNETNSNDGQNLSSSSRSADNSSPDAPSTDRKRKRQSDTNSSESPESGVEGDKRSRKNKKSSSSSSRSGSGSSSRSPTSEGNDSEKKRKRATKEQLDLLERVFEQVRLPPFE